MKVVVVGSGISGLSAAYYLCARHGNKSDFELNVLEATNRVGGVISTVYSDNCVVEEGPDSFLTTKPWAVDLCQELGLEHDLIGTNETHRRAFIACGGELKALPDGFVLMAPSNLWSFADSSILSTKGKIEAAWEMFRPSQTPDEDETLKHFIVRRFGHELFERIAQPMVGGIYTGDPAKLSARATLPQFVELEKTHGSIIRGLMASSSPNGKVSGARYGAFASLKGGMQVLVDRLIEKKDRMRLHSSVRSLSKSSSGWRLATHGGEIIDADVVILAAPTHKLSEIFSSYDSKISYHLGQIEQASSAILNLLFNREDLGHSLDGFGFVVPELENRSIIACSFSSNKFAHRAPAGKVLLRVFLGGVLHPEISALSNADLIKVALSDLRSYLSIKNYPEQLWLKRWTNSMPQYAVGHLNRIEQIKERFDAHQGLIWAGNSINGVGIPDCIKTGLDAAETARKYSTMSGVD